MDAKFVTVNTELHTLHTVRAGSKTERTISENIGQRAKLHIRVAGIPHVAFRKAPEAIAYLELLKLDGAQS